MGKIKKLKPRKGKPTRRVTKKGRKSPSKKRRK